MVPTGKSAERQCWHLITGEYPPQQGGVSDYTYLIARELAVAGDQVHVWAPRWGDPTAEQPGVVVHRLPDHFGLRSLRVLSAALNHWPCPSRLLVQYVPHAFGCKAMNVPFCLWLSRRRQPVWLMFHEVAFPREKGQSWKHRVLATVTGWMASQVAGAAERIFVSIPQWGDLLRQRSRISFVPEFLPIPSTLAGQATLTTAATAPFHQREIPPGCSLVGHFGTYGELLVPFLLDLVPRLLRSRPDCGLLLIGRGSETFQQCFLSECPDVRERIFATGQLSSQEAAAAMQACQVMLQPYPDGISCRRSSAMAALALGLPIVTTRGRLTETIWEETQAVGLAPVEDSAGLIALVTALLADEASRKEMGTRAAQLYAQHFSLERTISRLRGQIPA